jgi:hypothetical protein
MEKGCIGDGREDGEGGCDNLWRWLSLGRFCFPNENLAYGVFGKDLKNRAFVGFCFYCEVERGGGK